MPYVSAKYMPTDPLALPGSPRQVQATDDQGAIWSLTEDSQVGDWVRYLDEGGTIAPPDPPPPTPVAQQITDVPRTLTGGPTLIEVFSGND